MVAWNWQGASPSCPAASETAVVSPTAAWIKTLAPDSARWLSFGVLECFLNGHNTFRLGNWGNTTAECKLWNSFQPCLVLGAVPLLGNEDVLLTSWIFDFLVLLNYPTCSGLAFVLRYGPCNSIWPWPCNITKDSLEFLILMSLTSKCFNDRSAPHVYAVFGDEARFHAC